MRGSTVTSEIREKQASETLYEGDVCSGEAEEWRFSDGEDGVDSFCFGLPSASHVCIAPRRTLTGLRISYPRRHIWHITFLVNGREGAERPRTSAGMDMPCLVDYLLGSVERGRGSLPRGRYPRLVFFPTTPSASVVVVVCA